MWISSAVLHKFGFGSKFIVWVYSLPKLYHTRTTMSYPKNYFLDSSHRSLGDKYSSFCYSRRSRDADTEQLQYSKTEYSVFWRFRNRCSPDNESKFRNPRYSALCRAECMVQSAWCRVRGAECRVQSAECRVQSLHSAPCTTSCVNSYLSCLSCNCDIHHVLKKVIKCKMSQYHFTSWFSASQAEWQRFLITAMYLHFQINCWWAMQP